MYASCCSWYFCQRTLPISVLFGFSHAPNVIGTAISKFKLLYMHCGTQPLPCTFTVFLTTLPVLHFLLTCSVCLEQKLWKTRAPLLSMVITDGLALIRYIIIIIINIIIIIIITINTNTNTTYTNTILSFCPWPSTILLWPPDHWVINHNAYQLRKHYIKMCIYTGSKDKDVICVVVADA